jgi:fucose 4-O-acetylase-like acetyltransferase
VKKRLGQVLVAARPETSGPGLDQPLPSWGQSREDPRRNEANPRLEWVDAARGIGIVLVVLGHTIGGLENAAMVSSSGGWKSLGRFIYAFHMPLFFFLSGLFAERSARASLPRFLDSKLRTVAWPYLVWSIVQTLMQIAVGSLSNARANWRTLASILYLPTMQFWFLYALFWIQLLVATLVRVGVSLRFVFGVSVLLYATSQWIPVGSWEPLERVTQNLLYFAAGALVAGSVREALARIAPRTALFAGGLGWIGVVASVRLDLDVSAWARPLVAGIGLAGAILLGRALGPRIAPPIRYLGRISLQIYVAHTIASAGFRGALVHVLGVNDAWVHVLGGTLVGLLFPLLLARAAERAGWRYLFTFPKRAFA